MINMEQVNKPIEVRCCKYCGLKIEQEKSDYCDSQCYTLAMQQNEWCMDHWRPI